MPLSPSQLKRYWLELRDVARDIPSEPTEPHFRDFRSAFHAQHNLPQSTKDFTKAHFDTFLAACAAITKPDALKPQLRALDQPKTRLLHKILVEKSAMLHALDVADPGGYIAEVCAHKFRGRKPADLSADKTLRSSRSSVDPDAPSFSELDMLLWTIADRIKVMRQARGWSEHELLWQAGLGKTCRCADCSRSRRSQFVRKAGRVAPRAPQMTAAPF